MNKRTGMYASIVNPAAVPGFAVSMLDLIGTLVPKFRRLHFAPTGVLSALHLSRKAG